MTYDINLERLTVGMKISDQYCFGVALFGLMILMGCERPQVTPALPDVPDGKYRISEDDTLSTIARREYGDGNLWYVFLNANPELKKRPEFVLFPGEVINLPKFEEIDRSVPKSEFPKKLPAKYVVLYGDTMTFIAAECYGDRELWPALYETNKEILSEKAREDPKLLTVGQEILIPARPSGTK